MTKASVVFMWYFYLGLTYADVCGNTLLLFLAGFDTTATTLSYALYFLATNPEVQEKVYQEITTVLEEKVMNYAIMQCIYKNLHNMPL